MPTRRHPRHLSARWSTPPLFWARWGREHHPDREGGSNRERAHQRERCGRLFRSGYLCLHGLPANASCSFSPANINVSGTAPVPTLLTVNTAASSTASRLMPGFSAYGLAFAGLILLLPRRHKGNRVWAMLICVSALAAFGLSGCSSGRGPAPAAQTATGTYNFTVTASSGKVQTQSAYTLAVQ
jgi:hypothetical protein